jgi:hypothetical protein
MLSMNIVTVFKKFVIIIYKLVKVLKPIPARIIEFFNNEIYASFHLDLIISFLGGFSYFLLYHYIDVFNVLLKTNCIDERVRNKLNLYSDALQATSEASLQVFIIMILKLFLIIFSFFYYLISGKCNLSLKKILIVLKENLNEGNDPDMENKLLSTSRNLSQGKIANDVIDNNKLRRINTSRSLSTINLNTHRVRSHSLSIPKRKFSIKMIQNYDDNYFHDNISDFKLDFRKESCRNLIKSKLFMNRKNNSKNIKNFENCEDKIKISKNYIF